MNKTMGTKITSRILANIIREYSIPLSIIAAGIIIAISLNVSPTSRAPGVTTEATIQTNLQESVVPSSGVTLPITWGDLGVKLVKAGVIDLDKIDALYKDRGGFPAEYRKMLEKNSDERIVITNANSGYLLNLFWALGLANTNPILDSGEMTNKAYGGAGNFASTGGWVMAVGNPMDHYSGHSLITLTPEQQTLVDKVSKGIYRPCCNNSTHFPDCNHGMAMLGLLELMASQGVNERDMWKTALAVNSYWFTDTYLTIATYMKNKGVDWKDVNPQEILGINYSSASGYAKIASQVVKPEQQRGGSSCGV